MHCSFFVWSLVLEDTGTGIFFCDQKVLFAAQERLSLIPLP